MSIKSREAGTPLLTTIIVVVGGIAAIAITNFIQRRRDEKQKAINEARIQAFYKMERKRSVVELEDFSKGGTILTDIKINEIVLWEVEHLNQRFASEAPKGLVNHMLCSDFDYSGNQSKTSIDVKDLSDMNKTHYNKLINTNECILADIVRKPGSGAQTRAYIRAGPRRDLHFNPKTVNAAIVTCGGLCPGLNNVIREITNSLIFMYGVKGKVWGIRGGYKGFYDSAYEPVELTPQIVEDIHHNGGTMLRSSRGGFDIEKIMKFIENKNIKQLYVIGGDGTHRGAFKIHETCMEKVKMRFLFDLFWLKI